MAKSTRPAARRNRLLSATSARGASHGAPHRIVAVPSTMRGVQDIGRELGAMAVNTLRGSVRAAGLIGGDVARISANTAAGAVDAAERIGSATARTVRSIVAEARGSNSRKPPSRARITRKQPPPERERRRPVEIGDPSVTKMS